MATVYRCIDGDMLDNICFKHYGQSTPATELVLRANPGLADLGAVYESGLEIVLPDLPQAVTNPIIQRQIRIFDTSKA